MAKLRVVIKAEGLEAKVASFGKERKLGTLRNSRDRGLFHNSQEVCVPIILKFPDYSDKFSGCCMKRNSL